MHLEPLIGAFIRHVSPTRRLGSPVGSRAFAGPWPLAPGLSSLVGAQGGH